MERKLYNLTHPQKSICLTEQFYKGTAINNIGAYVHIYNVNLDILKKAINEMVKNNDAMRLKLKKENNYYMQYVDNYEEFDIDTIYLDCEEDIEKKATELARMPLQLENNFLFKFILFKMPNNDGGFLINIHHIIGDSWSLGLVAKEITKTYSEILKNSITNHVHHSYLKYLDSENEYLNSDKFNKDKEFWNKKFKTIPEIASIPSYSNNTTTSTSCKGSREKFNISKNETNKIKIFCKKHNTSLYNFFMSIYSLYTSKITSLDDFVIGTAILNRTNFEQKNLMGMFVSTIPLRINLNYDLSFNDFVQSMSTDFISCLRHQKYPYQLLLEDLRNRNSSIPNLYNIILSYQITKTIEENTDVKYTTGWVFNGYAADELQIHLFDLNDENFISVAYDFNSDKYSSKDILDLHSRILAMITQVISTDNILLKDIEILTPEEKQTILYDFNNTKFDYPTDKTIVNLFEEQVQKTPDNIAIVFEDQQLTYKELNEKSNMLAKYLIINNIKKGDIVGILLNKSVEVVISMLAILKAGACFLPLDVDYPDERLNYILNHSQLKCILSSKNINKNINHNIIYVDLFNSLIYDNEYVNNINIEITPEDLMYIMYTSGSTGNPKGVMVKHKNIIRLVKYPNFIDFSNNEVMVQTGTIVFDACIFEIFGCLLHGFKLHMIKKEKLLNLNSFSHFLEKEKVSILFLTTGLFNQFGLQEPNMFKNLRYLLTGGDVISSSSTKNILDNCPNLKIINCYGPTENGSYSTCYQITGNEVSIPIGKPITNSLAYVISNSGSLCPIGVPGELWVGGYGVSRGYLNNPDLTNEKFVKNPFGDGFVYKTGDLVKWLPDGNIEFIERIDNQVKIRGFRVELSEIDKQILTNNLNIKQSLTILNNSNYIKSICSYIVSNDDIDVKQLKNELKKHLPIYMLPTYIIQIEEFPLNINGKIDRKSLPLPTLTENDKNINPSRNDTDSIIIKSLSNILNINDISITDSFFDIGIDSLSAISLSNELSSKLNQNITVQDIFNYSTVIELSDYISKLNTGLKKSIELQEKREYYPLSSAQKRIYYTSSLDKDSILYNISGGIVLENNIEINKLEKCFKILIDRHDSLRTYFDIKNDDIVQIIDNNVTFNLEIENSNTNDLNKIYTDFISPFDLLKAPLFRAKLVNLKNNKCLLLLDMHHIISDGTSLKILINELCYLYNNTTLPKKQIDYKDFTIWEQEQFKTEEFNKAKEFWINQFKDEIPLLNMPSTYSRPSVQSFEGSNYHTILSKDIFEKINITAKKLNITPYMLMLSCYYILLSKYSSQDDIVVGSPIVGRELPELSNILGMFVNSLALRNKIDHSLSFASFSKSVKENCLNCFKNQTYPFDMLVKELQLKRDTSRNPLFDTMFIFQNEGYPNINLEGITAEYFIPDNNISKFDLSLEIIPQNMEYFIRFEYCTKLFDEAFIERLSSHYINILNTILENTDIKVSDIDILSKEERHKILYEFNDTTVDYPKDKTIVDLFEEQVEKTPDNIAVVFEDQQLTYKELNEKANSLARYLLENGVYNNSIVGIMLPRSLEMIIAMFGILKAGAAYLPLDPVYPKNRIKYILKDSNVNLVLTKDSTLSLDNISILDISISKTNIYNKYENSNFSNIIYSNSLAYVIYTSGSTGNPKGVTITHQNVNNFIKGVTDKIKFDKVIVSVTTICFDIFVLESILPLENGLTIVLANEAEQTVPQLLNELCIKNNVTMLQTTPSKFSLLTSDNDSLEFLKNMKIIMLGGEPFPLNLLERIRTLTKCKIYNMYGPTETTVWSSIKDLTSSDIITIGNPISNTSMYVLDNNLNLLPQGIAGTLYIGGAGLARGYLNKENLTNEKFITNPFDNSQIIYNTGDLAKWDNNGELICLGRTDFQVKIRGLRIELEEIEKIILTFKGIEKSVVSVSIDSLNRQILCAYFTSKFRISLSELKQYLGMFLPNYMIPTYIMQIDDFKYTPNGKIDKKLLPSPNFENEKKSIILPQTNTECELVKIWEDLLCISPISISDNFFEIGGDSLLALKMQIELIKHNINITYAEIFKYNTIKKLANLIDKKSNKSDLSIDLYSNYDYSNINNILNKNNISNLDNIEYTPLGNVLLTGVTGFLGAHILDYLIKNTNIKIYCLVRKDPSISLIEKVINKLHFYFGNVYDELINKRIFIIDSNLTEDNLGLQKEKLLYLSNNISCVINSAAIVKHYGNYEDFELINVTIVNNLVNFCKKYSKRLIQISTMSVSGNTLSKFATNTNEFTADEDFNESSLYIGQSLENVYIRSKFEAEKLILEQLSNNKLNALILRIGNITSRSTDGKFQFNYSENSFANKIKAFIEISALPEYILDKYIEFSPVDAVAEAVVKCIEYTNENISVLHIYNQNHVYLDKFIKLLPKDHKINIVSDSEFKNIIKNILNNDEKKYIVSHILNDLDDNNKLVYNTHIKIQNKFSQNFFDKVSFKWPIIDKKYIEDLLNNI